MTTSRHVAVRQFRSSLVRHLAVISKILVIHRAVILTTFSFLPLRGSGGYEMGGENVNYERFVCDFFPLEIFDTRFLKYFI